VQFPFYTETWIEAWIGLTGEHCTPSAFSSMAEFCTTLLDSGDAANLGPAGLFLRFLF